MSNTISVEELETLKKAELQSVASQMGLSLPGNATKDDFIDAIVAADDGSGIPAPVDSGAGNHDAGQGDGAMAGEVVERDAHGRDRKMYRLTLNSDDKPGGDSPLPVGVNGYVWTIPRDVEVEVPESVIDVLNDAVFTVMEKVGEDDEGRPVYKDRNVKRFSFSAVPAE